VVKQGAFEQEQRPSQEADIGGQEKGNALDGDQIHGVPGLRTQFQEVYPTYGKHEECQEVGDNARQYVEPMNYLLKFFISYKY